MDRSDGWVGELNEQILLNHRKRLGDEKDYKARRRRAKRGASIDGWFVDTPLSRYVELPRRGAERLLVGGGGTLGLRD